MALVDYVYSIYDDFVINHKVDITILQDEIEASEIIVTPLHHIDTDIDADECVIWFDTALTQPEETELDAIVAAHTGELPGGVDPNSVGDGGSGDIVFVYGDHGKDYYVHFNKTCYEVGTQFIFNGTNALGTPYGIKALLKGQGGIRLVRKDTCEVIFEWPSIGNINDFTLFKQSVINWPAEECILEIQGKKISGNLYMSCFMTVSYTHLTLPTKVSV